MNEIVGRVIPNTDPNEKHGWRWRVHHALAAISAAVTLIFGAMFIGLPMIGQLAWADDVDKKIDQKVAQAVKPIEQKVDDLTKQSAEQNAISNAFLAKLAEDSLIESFARMCKLTTYSEEWRKVNADYERFRADYAKAAKREYRELRCSEL